MINHEKEIIDDERSALKLGVCIDSAYLMEAVQKFKESKEKIYDLYNSSDVIEMHNLKSTIQYLDEFYDIIESESLVKRKILDQCR